MTFNAWIHALRNLAAIRDLTWILGDAASNKAADNWPGHGQGVMCLDLPKWAYSQQEGMTE